MFMSNNIFIRGNSNGSGNTIGYKESLYNHTKRMEKVPFENRSNKYGASAQKVYDCA